MSYILHIETATNVCSVAVSKDDELLVLVEEKDSLKHAEIITLQIKEAMNKAELKFSNLSAVSLSEGPGSYTSLRVGMSAAKAICYGNDLPLISINTLESLALASKDHFKGKYILCPMIDARRMEVYISIFNQSMELILDNKPLILEDDSFDKYVKEGYKIIFSGNGSEKAKSLYKDHSFIFSDITSSAKNQIFLGLKKYNNNLFEDIAYFSPNYIKPPNITTPKIKKL